MKASAPRLLSIFALVSAFLIAFDLLSSRGYLRLLKEIPGELIGLVLGILGALLVYPFLREKLPSAYNVAVIGFPQSGKSTLITSLFGEIFAGRTAGVRAILRGESTIERVNESLSRLRKGRALGPTKDQDRFSYRTDITMGRWPFSRAYKVEIGDFPGENTSEYIERYGPWLHKTEFFKWVVEANAFVFVIDLGKYLVGDDRKESVGDTAASIRAFWQHILEFNEYRSEKIRLAPLVLVFNKADLVDAIEEAGGGSDREVLASQFSTLKVGSMRQRSE